MSDTRRVRVGVCMSPAVEGLVLSTVTRTELSTIANVVSLAPEDITNGRLLDGVELLLTGWGCPAITARTLNGAPELRAVVHAAGSVRFLMSREAWERDLRVSSLAYVNAIPVAEYTVSMMHLVAKRGFRVAADYREGRHHDYTTNADTGFFERTIGIVGASRTGRLVIERLKDAAVRVLVSDPYLDPGEALALGVELVELDELLLRSDIVSMHAPLTEETRGLLSAERLALLRDGAALINTARGAIIDADALLAQCASGRIDAVLDVTDPEPLPPGHPLLRMPNVFVTPHVAGSSGTELKRLGTAAVDEIARYSRGEVFKGQLSAAVIAKSA